MTNCATLFSVAVILLVGVSFSEGLQCYQQSCLNCRNTTQVGSPGECNQNNFVHVGWLSGGQAARPQIPQFNIAGVTPQYTCIKFVSKDKNNANTLPNQIRGCVIGGLNEAEVQCASLIGQQALDGKTGECFRCQGNLCNSGVANGPILPLLAIGVISKLVCAML